MFCRSVCLSAVPNLLPSFRDMSSPGFTCLVQARLVDWTIDLRLDVKNIDDREYMSGLYSMTPLLCQYLVEWLLKDSKAVIKSYLVTIVDSNLKLSSVARFQMKFSFFYNFL